MDFITPLFEIMQLAHELPFSLGIPLDRLGGILVYRNPPLYSNGSEKRFSCTHNFAGVSPFSYKLSTVTDDPIEGFIIHEQMFFRYQLNPHCPPHMPPPPEFPDYMYRNQRPYLRLCFVEVVQLELDAGGCEVPQCGSFYDVWGVNIYTHPTGVFADFPIDWEYDRFDGDERLVLIYSTVPHVKMRLQRAFNSSPDSLPLIVDDAFIVWDTLGLVSLNDLTERGALHLEMTSKHLYDFVITSKRSLQTAKRR